MNPSIRTEIERIAEKYSLTLEHDRCGGGFHYDSCKGCANRAALSEIAQFTIRQAAQRLEEKAANLLKPPTDRTNRLLAEGYQRAAASILSLGETHETHE